MRLVVFTDYVYRQRGEVVYGERAFALFLAALSGLAAEVTIVGRLDPDAGATHYPLPSSIRFVSLPHYESLTDARGVVRSLLRSVRRFWEVLGETDAAWILGPYPHSLAFAWTTLLRRRHLVLGVRQDFPRYVRSRRPGRRWMHLAADLLELNWRLLARRNPVVVVGPDLAQSYRRTPALLEITVSLVSGDDVERGVASAAVRTYPQAGPLRLLSVGRLDAEKNPLLLADALALLRSRDPRWELVVCGEGPLFGDLQQRLADLGVASHARLLGYVPVHGGLLDLYRESHAFLHVSWTEGMPQVLIEAFASGLPVVATAVGGVAAAAGDAALLIPPGDPDAAVAAVHRIGTDAGVRARLVQAGLQRARRHTREAEIERVASFIAASAAAPTPGAPARRRRG